MTTQLGNIKGESKVNEQWISNKKLVGIWLVVKTTRRNPNASKQSPKNFLSPYCFYLKLDPSVNDISKSHEKYCIDTALDNFFKGKWMKQASGNRWKAIEQRNKIFCRDFICSGWVAALDSWWLNRIFLLVIIVVHLDTRNGNKSHCVFFYQNDLSPALSHCCRLFSGSKYQR